MTELDLGRARASAKDILARVRLGQDPAQDRSEARAKAVETFTASLAEYVAYKEAGVRRKTYVEIARHLRVDAKPLHPRPIAAIASDHRRLCRTLLANIAAASETAPQIACGPA